MHTLQNQVKSKVRIKAQRQKLNCQLNVNSGLLQTARLATSLSNRQICQARHLPRRPISSNWPAATPTGHFLSGLSSDPSARHVLVRPRVDTVTGRSVLAMGNRWGAEMLVL